MPPSIVLMGVAGSGKSTVGPLVAERLGVPFVDGDDAHAPEAKAQIARGEPLTEEQRVPWLERLHAVLREHVATGIVLACSALTIAARRRLADGLAVQFVALLVPEAVLAERLVTRSNHFAGPSILPSQLETLELDDHIVHVDADRPLDEVVAAVVRAIRTDAV